MKKSNLGITLVEVMVSVAIITFIMSVIIFDSKRLNNNLSLSSVVQEVSLTIRKAQAFGISVREATSNQSDFSYAYGTFFNSNDPTSMYLFVDRNGNGIYNGGINCQNECIEKISLRGDIKINSICVLNSGVSNCSSINKANITFLRPNPQPIIKVTNDSDAEFYAGSFEVVINFINTQGLTKSVYINSLGKITIQ